LSPAAKTSPESKIDLESIAKIWELDKNLALTTQQQSMISASGSIDNLSFPKCIAIFGDRSDL
jgi:hypothetical protein